MNKYTPTHSGPMVTGRMPVGESRESGVPVAMAPRTPAGRCGTCDGLLLHDEDFGADKCASCSRLAGPAPAPPADPAPPSPAPTPEEVRASVLAELTSLAEGLDPVTFWQTYILANTLATIIGMNSKAFRQWARLNKFELVVKRNPNTGKRANFLTVETARAVIRFRM